MSEWCVVAPNHAVLSQADRAWLCAQSDPQAGEA
jgi:hypothetical protein